MVPTPEVWAVGDNGVLHYVNGAWTANPNVTGMNGVVARNPTDVWAVGSNIQHWNGSWSTPVAANGILKGVASKADNNAWAVGFTATAPNRRPLIEHWDGTQWQNETHVPSFTTDSFLNSVDLYSATNIWAVGAYADGVGHYHTLTEHWDGFNWSTISSPDGDGNVVYNELQSIWYNFEGDVWAVGKSSTVDRFTNLAPLVLHWTDTQWQVADSPQLGVSSWLLGVGTTSGNPTFIPSLPIGTGNPVYTNGAWAVGGYQDTNSASTGALIEHMTAPSPPASTISYYEHDTDLTTHFKQGCDAAHNLVAHQQQNGLIILDYGRPIIVPASGLYGAALVPGNGLPELHALNEIQDSVTSFVQGYYEAFYPPPSGIICSPITIIGPPPSLTIGMAISNDTTPTPNVPPANLSPGHAQAWSSAVKQIQEYIDTTLNTNLTPLGVNVEAAVDFEPDWSQYSTPYVWIEAYSNTGVAGYINFGSTDGYPHPHLMIRNPPSHFVGILKLAC